jgi:hypothetical protein
MCKRTFHSLPKANRQHSIQATKDADPIKALIDAVFEMDEHCSVAHGHRQTKTHCKDFALARVADDRLEPDLNAQMLSGF